MHFFKTSLVASYGIRPDLFLRYTPEDDMVWLYQEVPGGEAQLACVKPGNIAVFLSQIEAARE